MNQLKCYLSEAITLLKQEEKTEFLQYYEFIKEFLEKNYDVDVFYPIEEESGITPSEIYWRDLEAVKNADFVVVEVSVVSWGVGEELLYAIMKSKPILALYNSTSNYKLSEMVSGSGIRLKEYSSKIENEWKQQLTQHLTEFMTELKQYLYLRDHLCAPIP